MMYDKRLNDLQNWLATALHRRSYVLEPMIGDASFRRYFRVYSGRETYIAMDAPPQKESCKPFITVNKHFANLGLAVPKLLHHDLDQGFILMSDLGDRLYFIELNSASADQLYRAALNDLLILQTCEGEFPVFDVESMLKELNNFTYWFLQQQQKLSIPPNQLKIINKTFLLLAEAAAAQPQVCVHRDYHSRNLLVIDDEKVGILDFQDAVLGPITYDAVSLLRDCYIDWPEPRVTSWVDNFYAQLVANNRIGKTSRLLFQRWFDWMGMQRHLKVVFIFTRKYLRDKDSRYLADIPRTLNYIKQVATRYPEFNDLLTLFYDKGILKK